MPVKIESISGRYVVVSTEGLTTGAEILDASERLYAQGNFPDSCRRQLRDHSHASRVDITPEQIRRLAGRDRAAATELPSIRIAVVGPQDVMFGLSRMWQAYVTSPHVETMVFRDKGSALKWLDAG
jgi:hypothetical protein